MRMSTVGWIINSQKLVSFFVFATVISLLMYMSETIATSFINKVERDYPFSKEFKDFYLKYSKTSNHLRKPLFIYKLGDARQPKVFGNNATLKDLVFSSHHDLDGNSPIILIQGDSWAQQFITYDTQEMQDKLKPLVENSNLIIAGVNSYSPSLMTAQLDYLKSDFDINPSILVAIIDQTDIGDELCRYRNLRSVDRSTGKVIVKNFDYSQDSQDSNVYEIIRQFRYSDILDEQTLNIIKLAKIAILQSDININRYFNKPTCTWRDISAPLYGDLSNEDKEYFLTTLKDYVSFAFHNNSIKKLIFVTHFHRLHRDGEYKVNVSNFIDELLERDELKTFRGRMSHVKFLPSDELTDAIFYIEDPASHLRPHGHSGHYLKKIIKEAKSE